MRRAKVPFQFVTASYLIRICSEEAKTLGELAKKLHTCTDASIFHHTFQSLERQHYTAFSNDFAQWTLTACNEAPLAERLAAVDIRDCISLADLRQSLTASVDGYLRQQPSVMDRPAFEAFHFCETLEFTIPRNEQANTLLELENGIRRISLQTLHHHFINSRLRVHLQTNDFSHWIQTSLDMPEVAQRVNAIDIYMNTLDQLRDEIIRIIHPWINE